MGPFPGAGDPLDGVGAAPLDGGMPPTAGLGATGALVVTDALVAIAVEDVAGA
jgi:hypothetical protein